MAQVVPLIRAAALAPFVRWMNENGRPTDRRLAAADLAALQLYHPDQPVPVFSVATFLRQASRTEGPDIGARVVDSASVTELATFGRVALGTRTPREALARIAAVLPNHCTHEHIASLPIPGGIAVREYFALPFDAETLHLIQQYVAALIRALCAMAGGPGPYLARVELVPHPTAGLEHLRGWLDGEVHPSPSRGLGIELRDAVLDRPFPATDRNRGFASPPDAWGPLRGDGSFSASARPVVVAMLADGTPSIERLAAAAGLSVRTLQRRLMAERTTFSVLLDEVRRTEALRELSGRGPSIGEISAMLGYARQSSLTRAVRRWTGTSPRRKRGAGR